MTVFYLHIYIYIHTYISSIVIFSHNSLLSSTTILCTLVYKNCCLGIGFCGFTFRITIDSS